MITRLTIVTILVRDQDEAVRFYTKRLGLEKRGDETIPSGFRWLTVAPRGQDVPEIVLVKADTDVTCQSFRSSAATMICRSAPAWSAWKVEGAAPG